MAFESLSENVSNTGKKTQDYVENTAEYYKLRLFKSSMKFATSLISMLVLGGIATLFLAFVSFGLSMYLSRIIGYPSAGFFVMGGFYLLIFLFIYFYGKKMIVKAVLEKFSELIIDEDDISRSDVEKAMSKSNNIDEML
ncbi:hypothetical protein SCB49_05972 [unidentified eubacterium SCB49]|nr:hypothetical protein SCB49_05972 [unidentified eubacterium SCB49]